MGSAINEYGLGSPRAQQLIEAARAMGPALKERRAKARDDQRVPDAELPIQFSVSGVGELAAQANGSPNRPASFQEPECITFRGRCLAILRPTGGAGEITLQAESSGLETAILTVQCEDSAGRQ